MKILVIAAHLDDEVLGVGGTILKHKEKGDEVIVCMVTDSYVPERNLAFEPQAKKVDRILQIDRRVYCNLPSVKLNSIPSGELNKKITKVIGEIKPDIIYTHFGKDIHRDHGIIFNAVMVATRPIKNKKIKVVCFETPSSTEWNYESFSPNLYVDITKFISKKIKAFSIYKSEVRKYPHPRSKNGVRILANKRGVEICVPYAEAFRIVRDVW